MEFRTHEPDHELSNSARGLVRAYRTALGGAVMFALIGVALSYYQTRATNAAVSQTVSTYAQQTNTQIDGLERKLDNAIQVFDERLTTIEGRQDITLQSVEFAEQRMPYKPDAMPHSVQRLFTIAPELTAIVHADKTSRMISAYTPDGALFSAPASFGQNPNPKTREGDFATPEGIYRVLALNGSPDDWYGSRIIKINYPNTLDRTLDRTGGGILICGSNGRSQESSIGAADFTFGGIRLRNDDATILFDLLASERSSAAIIIEDDSRMVVP